jgi:hypothetical protein
MEKKSGQTIHDMRGSTTKARSTEKAPMYGLMAADMRVTG